MAKQHVARRASITRDKYVNGAELARQLGVSRTTLNRWVKAGELPKPKKSISGMLLFERNAIGAASRRTAK